MTDSRPSNQGTSGDRGGARIEVTSDRGVFTIPVAAELAHMHPRAPASTPRRTSRDCAASRRCRGPGPQPRGRRARARPRVRDRADARPHRGARAAGPTRPSRNSPSASRRSAAPSAPSSCPSPTPAHPAQTSCAPPTRGHWGQGAAGAVTMPPEISEWYNPSTTTTTPVWPIRIPCARLGWAAPNSHPSPLRQLAAPP